MSFLTFISYSIPKECYYYNLFIEYYLPSCQYYITSMGIIIWSLIFIDYLD